MQTLREDGAGEPIARPHMAAAPLNALTIDVEDYYHVSGFEHVAPRDRWPTFEPRIARSTQTLLDLLAGRGVRATFFILGWVAEREPRLVRAIRNAGHEVGCHSHWHRLVYRQTPSAFRDDLRRSRDVLQQILGERVRSYRAPSFSVTRESLWALDVLLEEGFLYDSSMYPTYHDRYGIPEAPPWPHTVRRGGGSLYEFPMPICRKLGYPLPVGGGGYFRLYPYFFTRNALRSINAKGRPFVFYVHPWEVDPDQPRLPGVGMMRRFRHYVGLRRTEKRLGRLLDDFRFGTLSESLAACEARGPMTTWEIAKAA